jgi:hypothetical protein
MEKTKINYPILIILLLLVIILIYRIQSLPVLGSPPQDNARLIISDIETRFQENKCIISGRITNTGYSTATKVQIKCKPSPYPIKIKQTENQITKNIPLISESGFINFNISTECKQNTKYQCSAECDNCS